MTNQTTPTAPTRTRRHRRKRSTGRQRAPLLAVAAASVGAMLGTVLPGEAEAQAAEDPMAGAGVAAGASPAEVEAVEAALERLRPAGLIIDPADELSADATAAPGLASSFGKAVFRQLAIYGGSDAYSAVLDLLGFGGDDTAQALKEIRQSIDQLNAEIRAIAQQVEALMEGQDRANFYNSYTAAGTSANRLSTALASVESWIANDVQPSEANLSDMQTVIRTSVSDLAFQATNPVTGTIPLMMKAAEPAGVSDLEDYWASIDAVRDDYRAVLAEGLLTLDAMLRWDTSGTIAADLDTLTPMASTTVLGLYEYGLQVTGPDGAPMVQAQHADIAMAAWTDELSGVDAEHWRQTTDPRVDAESALRKDVVRPMLQQMVAQHEPQHHGGQTLEQFLVERDLGTRYVYSDQFRNIVSKYTKSAVVRHVRYHLQSDTGAIVGNELRDLNFGVATWDPAYKETWAFGWHTPEQKKAEADRWAADLLDRWRGATTAYDGLWHSGPLSDKTEGRMLLADVTNNVGGWAADFDEERVEAAAFGFEE